MVPADGRFLGWLFFFYAAGLAWLAFYFRHALNTDAVAYLRLASYYANGKWDLAISGYWGPLISWLLAPLLKLGVPPLVAARAIMAFSSVLFLWGCLVVYQAFALPVKWTRGAMIVSALAGLFWSVQFITPDLLLSGCICLAATGLVTGTAFKTMPAAMGSGFLWGLAYLTKAAAFPLAIILTLITGTLIARREPSLRRQTLRHGAAILLTFLAVSSPWVTTLSLKYHRPTFSTAAGISHTLTGLADMDRYHPVARQLRPPQPGRITDWEEPSQMAYHYWSALQNPAYARHQAKVIAINLSICLALLISLNPAWLLLLFALPLHRLREGHWNKSDALCSQALLLPALLYLLYLPCFVTFNEQRFFYGAFPFLLAALALWALEAAKTQARTRWAVALLGAAVPILAAAFLFGSSSKMAGDCAADLVRRLRHAGISGPVAGSGIVAGDRTGLFVAFLLDEPWDGDEPGAQPADYQHSGARLLVVHRDDDIVGPLTQDTNFADLDRQLFSTSQEAAVCPLKIFAIKPAH